MSDDFTLILNDIIDRHGGDAAFTPATLAIARKLAVALADTTGDPRLLIQLEDMLPPLPGARTAVSAPIDVSRLRPEEQTLWEALAAVARLPREVSTQTLDYHQAVYRQMFEAIALHPYYERALQLSGAARAELAALRAERRHDSAYEGAFAYFVEMAGRPLRDPKTNKALGWHDSTEASHRQALVALDDPSVPEQFRRPRL
jgi:hypothetical protein